MEALFLITQDVLTETRTIKTRYTLLHTNDIKQLFLCCPQGSLYSITIEDIETEHEVKQFDPGLELFIVLGDDALDKKQLLLVFVGDKLF